MVDFCHLHMHTEYSLLEGACRTGSVPGAAKALGQTHLAITDRNSMSGCVAFFRACTEAGIHPVIGCEISTSAREGQEGSLLLLCRDRRGYINLCALLSYVCTSRSPLNPELIKQHKDGLYAICSGSEGEIYRLLSRGDYTAAENTAALYATIFGRDYFYIGLENHGNVSEGQLARSAYDVAVKTGVGTVACNDVHYTEKKDSGVCRALCCIREGRTLEEGAGPSGTEYYLKSSSEMESLFGGFPGALENTVKIAENCTFAFDFTGRYLPAFPVPAGDDAKSLLRRLCSEGIEKALKSGEVPAPGYTEKDYRERTEYELSVIEKMGFCDYFLIVADYVGFAKRTGIPVGPGRGSGCGSAVAYFTGITGVDPLKYGLYFERFLNPERISMPDIDIDFDFMRRDEVLEYVKGRYGRDRVCQIITFGTLASRAALRDACRLWGAGPLGTDRVMSFLPKEDMPLCDILKTEKVKAVCASDRTVGRIFETAAAIEGYPRNISVHAAGVLITDGPAEGYLPLTLSGDTLITQYDMDTVASLGLLKFDFLALRYLTLLDEAERRIEADFPDFDRNSIPDNDEKTFRMLCAGRTAGVFQFEKEGITVLLKRIRPACLEDIVDILALYRPGPMDFIPKYIEGRKNPASVSYPHPLLRDVLEPTHGCIIYQEQVMSIFRIMAGYSAGHADLVRRAMSKKKAELLEAERGTFVAGAVEKGMSEADAAALFDSMSAFAGYAFNKSHAVAYAMISYRTAYIKANYPGYYLTSLMNVTAGPEKMPQYAEEAAFFGVRLLPPDMNKSHADFFMTKEGIRFGLSSLKGSGQLFAEAAEREAAHRPFTSMHDFVERIPREAFNRRACEACINCGAFDFLGIPRTGLAALLEDELEHRADSFRAGVAGQMDIFSSSEVEEPSVPQRVLKLPEYPQNRLRELEREICGISFGPVPAAGASTVPVSAPAAPAAGTRGPGKLFVKVPSRDSEEYRKCENLAEIFTGSCPLYFYFADKKEYSAYSHGIDATKGVIGFFREAAGEKAVVVR